MSAIFHEADKQVIASSSVDQVPFYLTMGGLYQVGAVGTWGGGSAVLEQLAPDLTTWLTVSASITANGGQTLYLPPGTYRWTTATATDVTAWVVRIPS